MLSSKSLWNFQVPIKQYCYKHVSAGKITDMYKCKILGIVTNKDSSPRYWLPSFSKSLCIIVKLLPLSDMISNHPFENDIRGVMFFITLFRLSYVAIKMQFIRGLINEASSNTSRMSLCYRPQPTHPINDVIK